MAKSTDRHGRVASIRRSGSRSTGHIGSAVWDTSGPLRTSGSSRARRLREQAIAGSQAGHPAGTGRDTSGYSDIVSGHSLADILCVDGAAQQRSQAIPDRPLDRTGRRCVESMPGPSVYAVAQHGRRALLASAGYRNVPATREAVRMSVPDARDGDAPFAAQHCKDRRLARHNRSGAASTPPPTSTPARTPPTSTEPDPGRRRRPRDGCAPSSLEAAPRPHSSRSSVPPRPLTPGAFDPSWTWQPRSGPRSTRPARPAARPASPNGRMILCAELSPLEYYSPPSPQREWHMQQHRRIRPNPNRRRQPRPAPTTRRR
jgi:hypothetical protein